MLGSHLGIFPSYYEPWGYTPFEAGALGVSSITTDLAGFGRYICTDCVQNDESGIFVIKRLNKKEDEVVSQLVGHNAQVCRASTRTESCKQAAGKKICINMRLEEFHQELH